MASTDQPTFQSSPPTRTYTSDSHASTTSTPTSPIRSQTNDTFFAALTARMRLARSGSSSSRTRSNSPTTLPPEHLPHTPPQPSRKLTGLTGKSAKPKRPTLQQGSDPWRGRHSNSWLFNDFSVTETAKSFLERRKS